MTYLVMETHLSYCVVLDEAGRFLKVANRSYEVGDTVDNIVPLAPPEKRRNPRRIITSVSGLAACLVLVFSLYWGNFMTPFASIYLSINPEVRMEISRQDTVVGISGMNDDGVLLADGYAYRGKSITQVADELVARAIDMGFLSDGGMVSINIDSPDEAWFESMGITLRQSLTSYLDERMTVTIEVTGYSKTVGETPNVITVPQPPVQTALPQTPTGGDSSYGDSGYSDSGYSGDIVADSSYGDDSYGDSVYGDSVYSGNIVGNSSYDSGYETVITPTAVPTADGVSGYGDDDIDDDGDSADDDEDD